MEFKRDVFCNACLDMYVRQAIELRVLLLLLFIIIIIIATKLQHKNQTKKLNIVRINLNWIKLKPELGSFYTFGQDMDPAHSTTLSICTRRKLDWEWLAALCYANTHSVPVWTDPNSDASFHHAHTGVTVPADMHQRVCPVLNLSVDIVSVRIIRNLRRSFTHQQTSQVLIGPPH